MWLYLFAGVLAVLGISGTFLGGGIYTIVLIPISVIIAGSALLYYMLGRGVQNATDTGGQSGDIRERPLPRHKRVDSGHVPTSPERLADARRVQQ